MKTTALWIGFLVLPFLSFSLIKTSVADGNWSSASTWSPSGAPSSTDKVHIYHTVTLDQHFTAGDTVFVYGVLSLKSNKILTLNPGTMILVNNANYDGRIGKVGGAAAIVGNFTFQKWITRCDGYSTYGMPFTVSVSDPDWYYCNQCMPSWSNLYQYDEAMPGIQDNGYYDNLGGTLQRGKGFFYWFANYAGGQNFPRQIQLTGAISFTTDFDFNITHTSSGSALNDGYNLVANPYPGTIDWLDGAWTKTNVSGSIYTWNSCTGSYATYVAGVGVNGGSRYISSMQGFWVQANASNPVLKAGKGVLVEDQKSLLRATGDSVDYLLKLELGGDEVALHLDPASTSGYDSLSDALKFFTPASRICTSIGPWNNQDYAINAVAPASQIIPVRIKGSGTLKISGLSSFYNQYAIYLKDVVNGSYQPLTENMQYTFTDTTQASFQTRFRLHHVKLGEQATGLQQLLAGMAEVSRVDDHIRIQLPDGLQQGTTTVTLVDLQGRLLYKGSFTESQSQLPWPGVPVLLQLSNDKGSLVKKVF